MIVPMQKLTLLCLAHDRAATLETLRNLGVLHVKPFVPPAGGDEDADRGRVQAGHRLDRDPEPVPERLLNNGHRTVSLPITASIAPRSLATFVIRSGRRSGPAIQSGSSGRMPL